MQNPRPYDVTTLFTVRSGCEDCISVLDEFTGVAFSYSGSDVDAFFAIFHFTNDPKVRDVFTNHGLKTVPYICTSKQQSKRENTGKDFYRTEDVWFVKKDDAHDAHVILEFVNNRLNHTVQLKLPFFTVLIKNIVLFTVLAVILATIVKMRPFLINQQLWLMISVFLYILCTSGFVYCQSHNVPIFKFAQDKFG